MLYQIHWQFDNKTTEMRAQKEINSQEEMKSWWGEVAKDHPLPEGAEWLICNEKSRHFVWAVHKAKNPCGSTNTEAFKQ